MGGSFDLDNVPPGVMTPAAFQARLGVSDMVLERLGRFVDLLHNWQRGMNLVSAASLRDVWRRHILDSAQLHRYLPPGRPTLVDLGSGAGFPGLVLAIMGGAEVHLIESQGRRCVFLREALRATGTSAVVHQARIESVAPISADVVTARACAPLPRLLTYAAEFLASEGCCLFLKGQDVEGELTDTHKNWKLVVNRHQSLSDPSGVVLRVEDVSRRDAA